MSKEFLTEDRVSTLSTSSQQEDNNNEQCIGNEFSSNIRVAELAIRSTAYKLPSTSMTSPTSTTIAESKVELPDTAIKQKRRVTFNLDNIQVKTISDYDSDNFSTSSISDTSSLHEHSEEEEAEEEEKHQKQIAANSNINCNLNTEYQERSIQEPIVSAERISKKESYDALQKKRQSRRDHQQPITKPGYWYPLAPHRISNPIRQSIPTRSLELTERLLSETIQREMLLNPSIKQQYTPPSPSPSPRSDLEEPTCASSSSSAKRHDTILVSDTDKEEPSTSEPTTTKDSPSDKDSSAIPKEEQRNDFTKAVYRQVSPISNYEPPCLTFPFEQNLVPIATNKNVLIISPPPSPQQQQFQKNVHNNSNNNDPVLVDHHTSLLINKKSFPKQERRGIFFIKVLKVESLDFPVENGKRKKEQ